MKRYIAILLALAFVFAAAACSSGNAEDTGTVASTAAETDSETVDIYADLPEMSLDGMTINIYGYRSSNTYTDSEYYTAEQTGESIDDALYTRNINTEERLGIKLSYDYPKGERDALSAFIASVTANDDMCDLFAMKAIYAGAIITSGTVFPWNDIEGINYEKPWYVQSANEAITIGGKQYGILSDALGTNITMCWTWVFNKRLANEWNIDDPYKTVNDGDWTMDTATAIAKSVYSDLNGDNLADGNDLYGFYTDSYATIDAFMVSHGVSSITKDANDYPVESLYSERTVVSIEKIYELYWNCTGTYVDTALPYEYRTQFANGQAVFSPMLFNYLIGSELRAMDDDYGVIPYPKLDEEQESYYTHMLGRTGTFFLPLTLSDDKKEVVGYVVDVLSAYSYQYLRPAIYDVSLSEKGIRDEQSAEMLELIMDSRKYDFSMFLESSGLYPLTPAYCYRSLIAIKSTDITSFYESQKEIAENYLAELTASL